MVNSATQLVYFIVLFSVAIQMADAKRHAPDYVKFYTHANYDGIQDKPRRMMDYIYYPYVCYNVSQNLEKHISSIVMHSTDNDDNLVVFMEKNCKGKWLEISDDHTADLSEFDGFNDAIASFRFAPKFKQPSSRNWFSKAWNWLRIGSARLE